MADAYEKCGYNAPGKRINANPDICQQDMGRFSDMGYEIAKKNSPETEGNDVFRCYQDDGESGNGHVRGMPAMEE
jgi:hypothetical protein